jgi:hypothetical protein
VVNREYGDKLKLKNVVVAHDYDEPEEYGSDGLSLMTTFLSYNGQYFTRVGGDEEVCDIIIE